MPPFTARLYHPNPAIQVCRPQSIFDTRSYCHYTLDIKSPTGYLPFPITSTAQCQPPPAPLKQWCSKPTEQRASATPPPPRKTASRHGTRMLCAEAKQIKPLPRCCTNTAGNYGRSGKLRRVGGRICDEVSLLGCGCRDGS